MNKPLLFSRILLTTLLFVLVSCSGSFEQDKESDRKDAPATPEEAVREMEKSMQKMQEARDKLESRETALPDEASPEDTTQSIMQGYHGRPGEKSGEEGTSGETTAQPAASAPSPQRSLSTDAMQEGIEEEDSEETLYKSDEDDMDRMD